MRFPKLMRLACPPLALVSVLLLPPLGCGDDGSSQPSDDIRGPLVFTREDSSEVEFPDGAESFVWCGPWEPDLIPVPSLHVWFGVPGLPGYWSLRAVLSDIVLGDSLRFPNTFIWDEPDSVAIFLFDPPNELAADTEESSGFVVFNRIPCLAGAMLDFSIDAVLGSEYGDMPTVAVRGRFIAPITGAPPGWEDTSRLPRTRASTMRGGPRS